MHIDWWTLALQTINLLVLVWFLGRFLFRPIARIVEERQAAIAKTLDDAKAMREQAQLAEAEAKKAAAKVAAERSGILEDAGNEATTESDKLIAQAREEANRLIEQARQEMERMRDADRLENDKRASELAADIASRLFDRLPEDAKISGFVDGLKSALAELPHQARDEMGSDGKPVRVRAARGLSSVERKACQDAITSALGRDVDIEVTVQPDLIAGLEIESSHALVRNSLRSDLDRITDELIQGGASDG